MNVIITKNKDNIINNDGKYVIMTNNIDDISKYKNFEKKPILIMFDGSYVIDLDKNNVIIDNCIDEKSICKIKKYALSHKVDMKSAKYNDKVYEIKLNTNNSHRRLVIPYMFKDRLKNVDTRVDNKDIYVINKYNSILNAIDLVFEYLNIKYNFMELEDICSYIKSIGFYKKGYEML